LVMLFAAHGFHPNGVEVVHKGEKIVVHAHGGRITVVVATAVALCIKKNHPDRDLIVVCAYPEIFVHLPFVKRVYRLGNTPYFYDDFINGKDTLIFKHEPYFTEDHIHKRMGLIQNWCKLFRCRLCR
jgi:hypothetical protein